MKKSLLTFVAIGILLNTSCVDIIGGGGSGSIEEAIVVANRSAGSVSFIDAVSTELIDTIDLPGDAEPMYVVYVRKTDKLYVGDRRQSKVYVMDPENMTVKRSIDVGNGVFHMWADGKGKRLWVVNDIDNAISVINLKSNKVMKTIQLDGKPHDVFLSNDGSKGYVSILIPDGPDRVYAFNANSLHETARTEVGEDPHLFHLTNSGKLLVPCQNTNQLLTLNENNLMEIADTSLDGAHGIFVDRNEEDAYVAGINVSRLYHVDAENSQQLGEFVSTSVPTPHNIVLNADGSKLFVTHSGATADQVSVFDVVDGQLVDETIVTTDTNPFGIAYFKR